MLRPVLVLLLSFVGGAVFAFISYRFMRAARRNYVTTRRLVDLPVTPIHDLVPGPAKICGRIVGDEPLTSPLTRTPCFYYRVSVDQRLWDGEGPVWSSMFEDTASHPFFVEDHTGRARIDEERARYFLPPVLQAEVAPDGTGRFYADRNVAERIPETREMLSYYVHSPLRREEHRLGPIHLEVRGPSMDVPDGRLESRNDYDWLLKTDDRKSSKDSFRFTEWCLPVEREQHVIGACVADGAGPWRMTTGPGAPDLDISGEAEVPLRSDLFMGVWVFAGAACLFGLLGLALPVLGAVVVFDLW